jgi:GyrI-like small molecule binding domain
MKKWLIGIGIVLIIFIACIYIFIPGSLGISQVTGIRCTPAGTYRLLTDKATWQNWWPASGAGSKANSFLHNGYSFTIQQPLPHGIDIMVEQNEVNVSSRIVIIPAQRDSVTIVWQCTYPSGNNPFKRISGYQQAVDLKNNFAQILSGLKAYLETPENVYGYNIQQTSTTDTLLIAARGSATVYPGLQEVYKLVNQLKDYIRTNRAEQTGYPMLNVTQTEPGQFQFQVAVPVNKELADKGSIFSRRMVPGNFLMLEAKGGLKTVAHAMEQLQQYAADHHRTSMAIPFEVMVTDRAKEQDTTKWLTRIYYPVM